MFRANPDRKRRLLAAPFLAIFAIALVPAAASALTPTIENTGAQMFEQSIDSREAGDSANHLEINVVVKHDVGKKVTGLKVDTDYNTTDNSAAATTQTVTSSQPTVVGGFNYTTAFLSFRNTASNIDCGDRPGFSHTIYVRPVLSDGTVGNVSSASIFFTPSGGCTGYEDYPYAYAQSNTAPVQLTPGGTSSFSFKANDADTGNNTQGYGYRFRRLNDGATTGETKVCPGDIDDTTQTRTYTFPNQRGHWVVEARLYEGDGCTNFGTASLGNYYWRIGSADVNTAQASSPALSLSATRPQLNGNTNVTATTDDADDSANGGAPQYIEWDNDGNSTYDDATLGSGVLTGAGDDSGALTAAEKVQTISTTGKTPGTYTVRARVTDNGAINASDAIRRQTVATTTYLVDSPPIAGAQSVTTETNLAKPITLAATDANGDTLTYTIATPPANGTLTGTGASRTYTPTAGFAGTDSFTFTANDGFGGTSTATVSVTVQPNTVITAAPSGTINARGGQITFTSAATGATFECKLDSAAYAACTSPLTVSDLPDGSHTVLVRATANAQTDASSASAAFTVNASPLVTIDSGPPPSSQQNTATFTFSASEQGSTQPVTTECRVDSDPFTACVATYTTSTGLAEGSHTFEVRGTDSFGKQTTGSPSFAVDTAPPETTLAPGPADPTNTATPAFMFSSSETGSTFECSVDAAPFQACTSPQQTAPLGEGQHSFAVRATDPAGNTDQTPDSRTFTVDLTPPETAITAGPDGPVADDTPAFEFNSPDTPAATFECRVDSGTFVGCTSPTTTAQLPDGPHTFEVRAVDPAGNRDPSPASRSIVVDTTGPETSITTGPMDPASPTNDTTPEFVFESPEAGVTFRCVVDGAAAAPCTSPFSTPNLGEGQHTFTVTAFDALLNADPTPASRTFTVDLTSPDTQIDSTPGTTTADSTPDFTFSAPGETGATFRCSIDGAAVAVCSSPFTADQLGDGAHTFSVFAVDRAGNADPTPASSAFTVDSGPPNTTILSGPTGPTNTPSPSFTFSSSEQGSTFGCSADGGSFAACTSPYTFDPPFTVDGAHTFAVRAIDSSGNTDPSPADASFSIDLTAPDTTITQSPTGPTSNPQPEFRFTADDNGQTFQCRIDSNDPGAFTSCQSPFTPAALGEGQHALDVRAIDLAGNVDVSAATVTFTIDLTAPVTMITGGPSGPTKISQPTFTFSSPDAASSECRIDTDPFTDCTGGSFTTSGPLGDALHTFEVRSTDLAANTESPAASRTFTVDTTSPQATILTGPAGPTNNPTPTFTFSSNETGATFRCRVDSDAFAPCPSPFTTGTLSTGSHTLDVSAVDPATNEGTADSRSFTVDTVTPGTQIDDPTPPGLTNHPDVLVYFSSNDPTATFECSVDSTSAFAACVSPKAFNLADGQHTIRIRARDAAGNIDSPADANVRVDTTPPVVTLTSPPSPTRDVTPTFTFTSEAGAAFECSLDAAAFTACDSPLTPPPLADGDHTLAVRATDQADNPSLDPARQATVTVDTTAPATTSSAPVVNGSAATFTFGSPDATATFECRIDNGAFAACASPRTYTGLPAGAHTFQVRAVDPAGNRDGAPQSRTVTIASTPGPDPVPDPDPTPQPLPGACANPKTGTARADSLAGTSFGDKLLGLKGNDKIRGSGGDDCLVGGAGNDKLYGGPGKDKLTGGAGTDVLTGGPGKDKLIGGGGKDVIHAKGGGRDIIRCTVGDKVKADKKDRVSGACTKGRKK